MKHLLIYSFLLFSLSVFAQNSFQIPSYNINPIPESPDAAALGRYDETPISTANGTIPIGVPLFQLNGRDMSIPVSISFNSAGITVAERATSVGLGWTLSSAGRISREMRGKADTEMNISSRPPIHWDQLQPPRGTDLGYSYFEQSTSPSHFSPDSEPDVFSFSIQGYSGSFIIQPNGETLLTPSDSGLKIEGSPNEFWTITTPEGYIYNFQTFENTIVESNSQAIVPTTDYISTWWVTEISHPNKGILFTFEYENKSIRYDDVLNRSLNVVIDSLRYIAMYNEQFPFQQISTTFTQVNSKILKKIDNQIGQTIEYEYEYDNRSDYKNGIGVRLSKIRFKAGTQTKQIAEFNQIGGSGSSSNYLSKRMTLNSVTLTATSDSNPQVYSFDYVPGVLPARNSMKQDHLGYFNDMERFGINNAERFDYRKPNPDVSQAGMLNQVTYPTGGYTKYIYEQNTYSRILDQYILEGDTLKNNHSHSMYIDNTTSSSNVTIPFTLDHRQEVKLDFDLFHPEAEEGELISSFPDNEFGIRSASGENIVFMKNTIPGEDYSGHRYVMIDAGDYEFYGFANGELDELFAKISYKSIDELLDYKYAPGLRVKSVEFYDNDELIKQVDYEYNLPDSEKSSGVIHYEPLYTHQFSYRPPESAPVLGCGPVQMRRHSFNPINQSSGIQVGYETVRVTAKGNIDSGSTLYTYTTAIDYSDGSTGGFNSHTNYQHRRGLLKSKKVFNSNQELELLSSNIYESNSSLDSFLTSNRSIEKALVFHVNVEPKEINQEYFFDIVTGSYDLPRLHCPAYDSVDFDFRYYYHLPDWIRLKESTTTTYEGNEELEQRTTYDYDGFGSGIHSADQGYIQDKVRSWNSEGNAYTREIQFPNHYADNNATDAMSAAIRKLKSNNMLSTPIETTVLANGTSQLITYKVFGGKVLPHQVYRLEAEIPLLGFQESYTDASGFHYDSRYQKVATFTEYDTFGNIQEVEDRLGVKTTYLWAYDSSRPVAKIANASLEEVEAIIDVAVLADSTNESQIKTMIAQLQSSLTNSFVSGYIYDNNTLQLTEIIDANGITSTYEYDDLQRLKQIKDDDDFVLSKYIYHYRESQ